MASNPPPFLIGQAANIDPMADPVKMATLGRKVSEKLRATPGAIRMGGGKVDLFVIPDFVDPAECARLVAVVDSRIGPSTLFKGDEIEGFRTSSTHHFDNADPEIDGLQKRICAALGIPQSHAEVMQGQRYEPGQQYKHHNDYFFPSQPYWQEERRRGGQRTWTAMVILGVPDAGGATDFARIHEAVQPQPGALVTWNNMDPAGLSNPFTLHAGMPVEAGVKHVITQWFRQEEWSLYLR